MAKIFPSIFPYSLDDPEMLKLGIQTEYEVYSKLKKFSDDFEILIIDDCSTDNSLKLAEELLGNQDTKNNSLMK